MEFNRMTNTELSEFALRYGADDKTRAAIERLLPDKNKPVQKIKLDDCYLDDVLEGLKISTIRAGHRKYTLGEAKLVTTSKSVDIIITKITHVLFKDLILYDAVNDGFSSLEELKDTLIFYYPNLSDNDEVTIVYYDIEV